jgi:hypothetical protein
MENIRYWETMIMANMFWPTEIEKKKIFNRLKNMVKLIFSCY